MKGTLDTELEDLDALEAQILRELSALRSGRGRLTIQKFSHFEALRLVCGGMDLVDAFLMFERELRRYKELGRDEAAAAISIASPYDSVLGRLEDAASILSGEEWKDQRTARRWSDAGLRTIARDLVQIASVRGRLGTELMSIDVENADDANIFVTIDQMTTSGLQARAPRIRVWTYKAADDLVEREITADLENFKSASTSNDEYTLSRHRLRVALPGMPGDRQGETKLLSISVEGRDSPMRTVMFEDKSQLAGDLAVRFATYRTIATVEVVALPIL